jgi:hypothetical protein
MGDACSLDPRSNKMKMFLVAALALVSTSALAVEMRPEPMPSAEWLGYSVSPNGRIFRSEVFNDEQRAKATARAECSTTSLRTCDRLGTIAVAPSSYVAAITCGGRESFIGGSNIVTDAALWMAKEKARSRNWSVAKCRQVFDSANSNWTGGYGNL